MEGFTGGTSRNFSKVIEPGSMGVGSSPVESGGRCKTSVEGLGNKVPQKLKQHLILVYYMIFNVFL